MQAQSAKNPGVKANAFRALVSSYLSAYVTSNSILFSLQPLERFATLPHFTSPTFADEWIRHGIE
jgi:hypothetical protein